MLLLSGSLTLVGLILLCAAVAFPRVALNRRLARLLASKATNVKAPTLSPRSELAFAKYSFAHRLAMLAFAQRFGWRVDTMVKSLRLAKVILSAIAAALILLAQSFLSSEQMNWPLTIAMSAVIGIPAGPLLVRLWLTKVEEGRRKQVNADLTDIMELLLVSQAGGLSLEHSLQRVTKEVVRMAPVVAMEFEALNADIAVLGDYDHAFGKLAERNPTPNIISMVNIIRDSLRHGTAISKAIEAAVKVDRERSVVQIDLLANSIPPKMTTVAMALCFPPLILVMGAPPLFTAISAFAE